MPLPSHSRTKATIKILSLNVKGLNLPEKRSHLLTMARKMRADAVLIQETHFRSDNIPKLTNKDYPVVYHATNPQAKTKGVSILLSKHSQWKPVDTLTDCNGRYILLKGQVKGHMTTIANIYSPNTHQVGFITEISELLTGFQQGTTILGGDFNVALNPLLDTSSGTSTITYRALSKIKKVLQNLTLHDAWRTIHPTDRDYTYFSPPHNKYSRIDYLFLTQKDLPFLSNASIEPMWLSDHHPISLTLTLPKETPFTKIWRLDPSLLTKDQDIQHIKSSIESFFDLNDTPDTSPIAQWEAHKCCIRGTLIAMKTARNKIAQAEMSALISRIQTLETTHKQSRMSQTLQELTESRSALRNLLDSKHRRRLTLSHKLFYEHSNKCGRILARCIRARKTNLAVQCIKDSQGTIFSSTPDIARQFEKYYSDLYNLNTTLSGPENTTNRAQIINSFLEKHCPRKLSPDEANLLDRPLSELELHQAVKQLKTGKSPGPDGFSAVYYRTFTDSLSSPFLKAFNALASPQNHTHRLLQ